MMNRTSWAREGAHVGRVSSTLQLLLKLYSVYSVLDSGDEMVVDPHQPAPGEVNIVQYFQRINGSDRFQRSSFTASWGQALFRFR